MKYKAIIFDMDGTIITTETLWQNTTMHMLMLKGGLSEEESRMYLPILKGASLYATCEFIKEKFKPKESVAQLMKEKEDLAFKLFRTEAQLIAGFDKFHKKICSLNMKSAIATNATQTSVNEILRHLPLHNYFKHHIYSIDQVNKKYKPHPDVYLHAADKLKTLPHFCIAIEDSAHGIAAAKAAGMFCIGINTGNDRAALKQADMIIDSYDEINIEELILLKDI